MRSMLVAPGVPRGTPAVMAMRSPGRAKPSWYAMPRLRLTGRGLWITALIVPPLAFVAIFIVYPIIAAFTYAFFVGSCFTTNAVMPQRRISAIWSWRTSPTARSSPVNP